MSIRIRREGLRIPRDEPEPDDLPHQPTSMDDGGMRVVEPHLPGRPVEIDGPLRLPQAGVGLGAAGDDERCRTARRTIAQAIFKEAGKAGSTLEHPTGLSFTLDPKVAHGDLRSPDGITVPLPEGHTTRHQADIHLELDNGARLVLDVLPSYSPLEHVKALAFDALQLRRQDRCFAVLVFVRCAGTGLAQEQVEAIGHGYDYIFGVDDDHSHSEARYAALRSRIGAWMRAAEGS